MVKTILNSLKYNQEKAKINIILKILYYILYNYVRKIKYKHLGG